MANKSESIEGKLTTLECMVCRHRETFTERQFKTTDGYKCEKCNGPVNAMLTKPGEKVENRRMNKPPSPPSQRSQKKNDGLQIKVNVDVSDALKGLKAVQREAKRTVRLLKEVEERKDIRDLSDDELLDEFRSRGWVAEDSSFYPGNSEEPLYRRVEIYKTNEKQEE